MTLSRPRCYLCPREISIALGSGNVIMHVPVCTPCWAAEILPRVERWPRGKR